MALNATTLSAAVGLTDTSVLLASLTGITAPNYQIGDPIKGISSGVTYLLVEQEMMKVTGLIGTVGATVVRGELGSLVSAHGASAPVIAGLPTDFPSFSPAEQTAVPQLPLKFQGFSAPVASATSIVASGPYFHVTGTTTITNMTPPAGYIEGGEINIVFDGVAPITSGGSGTGPAFAVNCTPTTAGSMISFVLDRGTNLWYPSRLA